MRQMLFDLGLNRVSAMSPPNIGHTSSFDMRLPEIICGSVDSSNVLRTLKKSLFFKWQYCCSSMFLVLSPRLMVDCVSM